MRVWKEAQDKLRYRAAAWSIAACCKVQGRASVAVTEVT
eukprot:CAMPEP_0171967928 /NCGR_PEP_ID=MMETSP0993-20121228/200528_1 /TAXON_ID=483369 /ORGANISM="non described non described, Strain CCMP2098" /LENGTH=38 /DNA_ID= /DNA_START= /DNA_END= /DNA_ORIENTATION=